MELHRRSFLKGMGALGGFAATGVSLGVIAQAAQGAKAAADTGKGVTKHVKSGCAICPNFCGIEGIVVNGVVRAIYPDAGRADYYNHGICPKGASGMFNTYNPYRLKKPLRRTNPLKGPKEDPRWEEVSWDDAFREISVKLARIRHTNPAKLIVQYGQGKYLIQEHFPRAFCDAIGSPNYVHRTTTCEAARHVADDLTWGYHGILPDLKHMNLLLNFGANYHEGEQAARWLDFETVQARDRGMKAVVIEPRLSASAAKADQWVPVRPGKDVVVLLAMAKLLIERGTIDEEFLVTYTNAPGLVGADGQIVRDKDGKTPLVWDTTSNGARPFVQGVKPALKGSYSLDGKPVRTGLQVFADSLRDVTPQYAEEVAGIPAATIIDLAERFAREAKIGETIELDGLRLRYRPVAVYSFRGLAAKEYGLQNWRAALLVNMLVGSIDAVGGLKLMATPLTSPAYMAVAQCEYPPKRADLKYSVFFPNSHHDIAQQPNLVAADPQAWGLPYQPEMQIFYGTNRPFSTSNAWQQFEGLKKTYNVVIDVVMSESCWYADIVLPDKTYLESWHFAPTRSTPEASHAAIRQPMTNPYNLEHDAYSIFWELAKRLNMRDEYAAACNRRWGLKEVTFKPGRDYTDREAVEVIWADKTKQSFAVAQEKGFIGSRRNTKSKYLTGIEAKFKGPGTPKMKFYADQMVGTYEKVVDIAAKNNLKKIDAAKYKLAYAPLPAKEHAFPTPHREAKAFPLYLITHKSMYRNQSGFTANNALLNRALGPDAATNYVAINAATARRLGIRSGDAVMIETRVGKVKGQAQVTEGIRPDTVAVSYHFGQWSPGLGPDARTGTWLNQVLEAHPDVVSGMDSFNDTKCKVYKA